MELVLNIAKSIAVLGITFAYSGLAYAFNITTTGTWTSGLLDGPPGAPSGLGTNQIFWGIPVGGGNPSSYVQL